MPGSERPLLRAAQPQRRTFDVYNGSSRGHQHADNMLAQSMGWRDSRHAKLRAQWREGFANDGGERLSDLVGAGAVDEGLSYHLRQRGITKGDGLIQKDGNRLMVGGKTQKLQELGLERRTSECGTTEQEMVKRLRNWDGRAREEKICHEVRGVKRGRDGEDDCQREPAKKRPDRVNETLTTGCKGATTQPWVQDAADSDEVWDTLFAEIDPETFIKKTFVAKDDDEVWDETLDTARSASDEPPRLPNSIAGADLSTNDHPPSRSASNRQAINQNRNLSPNHPSDPRSSTPPCGQTIYPDDPPAQEEIPSHLPTVSARLLGHSRNTRSAATLSSTLLRQPPKPIFLGLTMHISGPTLPLISDHALRQLLVSHSATVVLYVARRQVTHVVIGTPASESSNGHDKTSMKGAGGVFAGGKLDKEMRRLRSATGGPGLRFVRLEWVLESVRAGRRLSEAGFAVGMPSAEAEGHDSSSQPPKEKQEVREVKIAQTNPGSHAGKELRSGPLTRAERASIGSKPLQPEKLDTRRRLPKATPPRKVALGFQKSLAQRTIMPGAPPGVPSIRSLFLKQHRDNTWTKAGFTRRN